eukprot:CAMPEP_0183739310 /NCGR_PEP_ID=MMETSP0737-20130205/56751_1 /TAXON_ID=385413 /ORGANISM="Thalassiosira miniscula, Strain CCMP1093" /LENGTH=171 /DNA_ID=CAMNT_0025974075 /DNA_START=31 /DNA_END=546 /DNA_ORIENTATION=+
MSSSRTNHVVTPLGVVLPARIAQIIDDAEQHPERGRVLDRINPYPRPNDICPRAAIKKRRTGRKKAPTSSLQFKCTSCANGEVPSIEGSIIYHGDGRVGIIECSGYLVSLLPNDANSVVIVIDIPARGSDFPAKGMVPCVCRICLLDNSAIAAIAVSSHQNRCASAFHVWQ